MDINAYTEKKLVAFGKCMSRRKGVTGHQILLLVSFFCGILIITIMAKGKIPENTLMNQALAGNFLEEGWNRKALFLQCLWKRGTVLFLIILLTCTVMRVWICRAMIVWLGFVFGILLKLFYLWYGMKGMGLLVVSMLPHYLFYIMAYGLLYWNFEKNRMRMRKNYFPVVIAVAVVIMGIVLESYVNPFLVGGYLKIFF